MIKLHVTSRRKNFRKFNNACTVAELIGVHSNFLKLKIVIVYKRILKITALHTTHTCMYGLYA